MSALAVRMKSDGWRLFAVALRRETALHSLCHWDSLEEVPTKLRHQERCVPEVEHMIQQLQ
jgi:hypothetical protein